jgi:type I restriction enzyme S subunit
VGQADVRYIAYALRAEAEAGFLELQAGNVRQRAVDFRNWQVLAGIEVPLPEAHVQRRIADYLDSQVATINDLIATYDHLRHLLARREAASLRRIVADAPDPTRPLAVLADYVNGYPFKPDDFTPTGLPVIRIRQLVDRDADQDLFDGWVPDRVLLRDSDLVFSWSASLEVREWDRGPAILNQHLFRVLAHPGIDPRWLRWALHVLREDFGELMHGSTMTHITQPMMHAIRVPVPSLEKQHDVAATADAIHAQSSDVQRLADQQIARLRERRKTMLVAAVTGCFDVPEVAA